MLDRTRIGLLALLIFASLVACDASATPLPSNPPAPTTTAIDVAPAYRPDNPGPVSALERFLKAEVTGDFEASFEFLSPTDQEAADGVEGWVAQHYLVVPTIRGFQLISDDAEGVRAEVLTDLTLQAGLDQLVGLIPGEAQATWVLVDEAGEWRVAFSESRITPVFLDDATTAAGVAEWAGQSCPRDSGLDLPLLGYPVLADPSVRQHGPGHGRRSLSPRGRRRGGSLPGCLRSRGRDLGASGGSAHPRCAASGGGTDRRPLGRDRCPRALSFSTACRPGALPSRAEEKSRARKGRRRQNETTARSPGGARGLVRPGVVHGGWGGGVQPPGSSPDK